jgi:hypothetical protein
MEDHRGHLVPVDKIRPIDLLRNDLVTMIVARAKVTSEVMGEFKAQAMSEISAFVEQSAQEYGVSYGGMKGNIQLMSFDGRYKVLRSVCEYIVFDERLQIAKQLVDDCIKAWTTESSSNIRALINSAFEVDKGKVNTDRILSLRRLNIDDPRWRAAMDAISDSMQVNGSKEYIRVYERRDDGGYDQIPLDMSAVAAGKKQ